MNIYLCSKELDKILKIGNFEDININLNLNESELERALLT